MRMGKERGSASYADVGKLTVRLSLIAVHSLRDWSIDVPQSDSPNRFLRYFSRFRWSVSDALMLTRATDVTMGLQA